jgi:hypothetical protein
MGFLKKVGRSINKTIHQPGRRLIRPVVRIAAPIAGTVLGGPLGGAAGGFLGNKVTGGSTKSALKAGLLSGAAAYALPHIAGGFTQAFPGASNAIQGASNSLLGRGATSFLGNALGGGGLGGSGAQGVLGGAGSRAAGEIGRNILTGGAGQAAAQGLGSGFAGASGGGLGSLLSSPTLALGALGLLSIQSSKRQAQKERERYNREVADIENGLNNLDPTSNEIREAVPLNREYIPYTGNYSPYEAHSEPQYFRDVSRVRQYAEGGTIAPQQTKYFEGNGGGQDDDIPTMAEEGGFYLPADVVSDLGDGNPQRGALNFNDFIQNRAMQSPNRTNTLPQYKKGGKVPKIPARVSAGELYIPPFDVAKIGKGSNKKGTSMLEKMMKNVRMHKSTKKHPPKAKSVSQYMKMAHAK